MFFKTKPPHNNNNPTKMMQLILKILFFLLCVTHISNVGGKTIKNNQTLSNYNKFKNKYEVTNYDNHIHIRRNNFMNDTGDNNNNNNIQKRIKPHTKKLVPEYVKTKMSTIVPPVSLASLSVPPTTTTIKTSLNGSSSNRSSVFMVPSIFLNKVSSENTIKTIVDQTVLMPDKNNTTNELFYNKSYTRQINSISTSLKRNKRDLTTENLCDIEDCGCNDEHNFVTVECNFTKATGVSIYIFSKNFFSSIYLNTFYFIYIFTC